MRGRTAMLHKAARVLVLTFVLALFGVFASYWKPSNAQIPNTTCYATITSRTCTAAAPTQSAPPNQACCLDFSIDYSVSYTCGNGSLTNCMVCTAVRRGTSAGGDGVNYTWGQYFSLQDTAKSCNSSNVYDTTYGGLNLLFGNYYKWQFYDFAPNNLQPTCPDPNMNIGDYNITLSSQYTPPL